MDWKTRAIELTKLALFLFIVWLAGGEIMEWWINLPQIEGKPY